jgi:hypothetical protein
MFREARKGQFEWRNTIAPLHGDWVVLLTMKDRHAPMPASYVSKEEKVAAEDRPQIKNAEICQ